jgi:hypothetical protein
VRRGIVILVAGLVIALLVAFWLKIMHFLGWDGQTSDYYAAWSSSIPALIALLGFSSLFAGFAHHINCHEPGCWRFGRHHVNGSVWCNLHHLNARPQATVEELLERIELAVSHAAADSKAANEVAIELNREILAELRQ